MKKTLVVLLVAALFASPAVALLAIALFMTPAAQMCTTGSLTVTTIPDKLTATTKSGQQITLDKTQLTHAATIITVGGLIAGVEHAGVRIALMAALTESNLRMLANTGAYPESGDFPNDGNGSDHDSLGLFQMRPAAGWGTVAELMDSTYQAKAFYGGPTGPNFPSPRGLLDIPGWEQMDPGEAAQAVEVSAYPDRYQEYQPVADAIIAALTASRGGGNNGGGAAGEVPETSRVVVPMPEGSYTISSRFGPRVDPVTGEAGDFHWGTDFAAPDGTPILSTADGVVRLSGYIGGWGNLIVIEHTVGGQKVASLYAHMWDHGIHVIEGQLVVAGQHIGDVGSSGKSTGPHLHFEILPGGWGNQAIDSGAWLTEHGAVVVGLDETMTGGRCTL